MTGGNDKPQASLSRRSFVAVGAVSAATVGLGAFGVATGQAEAAYVRPPGAQAPAEFLARCNRCDRCVQACPYDIVFPVPLSEGIVAYGTPQLVFDKGYCDFCMKCVEACPTGALTFGGPSENDCGVAVVDKTSCVAWSWAGCTLCHDRCPVDGAIVLDNLNRPVVDPQACNGCGVCENICPSASVRAYDAAVADKGIVVLPRAVALEGEGGAK